MSLGLEECIEVIL